MEPEEPTPSDHVEHDDAQHGDAQHDDAQHEDEDAHTGLPPKVEAWRRRSAAGAILTGFALGLQEALETKRDEPSIVVQTSGDPPKDLPVEADFEYGRPRQSVVNIRPWLLPEELQGVEAIDNTSSDDVDDNKKNKPGKP